MGTGGIGGLGGIRPARVQVPSGDRAVSDARPVSAPVPDAFAPQPARSPFVHGVSVFNDRRTVTLEAPVRMVEAVDAAGLPSTWHAELDIPLSQFGVGAGPLTQVTLGAPWRTEATPGEPLPFTVSNGVVHLVVPNAQPSLELWGNAARPAFGVEGSRGQRVLLEVQPRQLTRDTTALNVHGLTRSIAAVESVLNHLEDSAQRLRAFLADPGGAPGRPAARRVAEQVAALEKTDAAVGVARAAAQARFDRADPTEKLMVAVTSLSRQSTPSAEASAAALIRQNNQAVAAREHVARLTDELVDLRPLLPAGERAAREAALAQAQVVADQARKASDAALEAALGALPLDATLSATDDLYGAHRLRSLLAAQGNQRQALVAFRAADAHDLAAATAQARASLADIGGMIDAEQAKRAEYQRRLLSPAEVVTVDLTPRH